MKWLDSYLRGRASLLRGEHVLPLVGGKGSKVIGDILAAAWIAQRAGLFSTETEAVNWLHSNYQAIL
jgi:hypothetical protein